MNKQNAPICMAEDYWANTQFSVARYSGGIKAFGHEYMIVNKQGITIFELSDPTSKHYVGDDEKAINPGEPADLCRVDWIPIYKDLGRDKFIEYIKSNVPADLEKAKEYVKRMKEEKQ